MVKIDKEICNAALGFYGPHVQSLKAIEEFSECAAALARLLSCKHTHPDMTQTPRFEFVAELADVMVIIMEMRDVYNITDDELQQVIDAKLSRLRDRLINNLGEVGNETLKYVIGG